MLIRRLPRIAMSNLARQTLIQARDWDKLARLAESSRLLRLYVAITRAPSRRVRTRFGPDGDGTPHSFRGKSIASPQNQDVYPARQI